jgi:hypothetical protein
MPLIAKLQPRRLEGVQGRCRFEHRSDHGLHMLGPNIDSSQNEAVIVAELSDSYSMSCRCSASKTHCLRLFAQRGKFDESFFA